MARNRVRNFQRGSTGRSDDDKTITVKSRSKSGTLAYNVRCDPDRKSRACKVALALMQKAQSNLANVPDDNDKRRRITKRKGSK